MGVKVIPRSCRAGKIIVIGVKVVPRSRRAGKNSPCLITDTRWRNPDLHEVIEFLSHPSNSIKANAAAYLQHLTYGDNDVKAKTR